MALLNAEQILNLNDLRRATVHVPDWQGDVLVREPTAAEQEEYRASLVTTIYGEDGKRQVRTDFANSRARLVVKCCINEDGSRMFSDADASRLGAKSSRAVDVLYNKIQELAGNTDEAKERIEQNF